MDSVSAPDSSYPFLLYHILTMSAPLPPANTLRVVHVTSIKAALTKLNLDVPIEDLLRVVQEEEEARRSTTLTILSKRKSGLILHPNFDNECFQFLSNLPIHSLLFTTLPNQPTPIHQQTNLVAFYLNSLKRLSLTGKFQIRSCRLRGSGQSRGRGHEAPLHLKPDRRRL